MLTAYILMGINSLILGIISKLVGNYIYKHYQEYFIISTIKNIYILIRTYEIKSLLWTIIIIPLGYLYYNVDELLVEQLIFILYVIFYKFVFKVPKILNFGINFTLFTMIITDLLLYII